MDQGNIQIQPVVTGLALRIAGILQWGLIISLVSTGIGVFLILFQHDRAVPPLSLSLHRWGDLVTMHPAGWIAGGIIVLLLTPLVSVGMVAWEIGRQRQWPLFLAAVAVMAILLFGLIAGIS